MNSQTIEALFGLSCSGKSFYSKDKVEKDTTWKRVNKDDIRSEYLNKNKRKESYRN